MDTLEQLIAKFDREYPDDMRLAREALQANPLKASDLIGIDITDALLCHEINSLRAELAECKRDAERYRWLRSESCPWPGVFSFEGADDYGWDAICEGDLDQAIDDALAAKGEL